MKGSKPDRQVRGKSILNKVANKSYRELTRTLVHLSSLIYGLGNAERFDDVEKYCMFIGYPRSGHSLIGALLDAHPQMIIAHEQDALKYVQAGYDKRRIFDLLLCNSRVFAGFGRRWRGFSYRVPNQWQGRFDRLKIIGDKKGGRSTRRLRANPGLLDLLREAVELEIKFIHIIRNPFDNISTISLKHGYDLRGSIEFYFSLCETVSDIKKRVETEDLIEMRHESFIEDPLENLFEICNFLGAETSHQYLDDCAAIIYEKPHKSRHRIHWSDDSIRKVEDRMPDFPFLRGYTYDE